MPQVTSESEWATKITAWRNSGLSIAAWCRENVEGYHRFLYWRQRLQELEHGKSGSFVPLHVATTPILLECNGIYVHISPGFDAGLLKDVLSFLKKSS
ncbi:MAG: hypothetical protein WC749_16405 [Dehalococcoidia bacterium]